MTFTVGFGIYSAGFTVCADVALSYLVDSYQDVSTQGRYENQAQKLLIFAFSFRQPS